MTRNGMTDILLSLLLAISLWPVYALLCAALRWRYGRAAVAQCIVANERTFARIRLLLSGLAVPGFFYLFAHNEPLQWMIFFYLLALLTLTDLQMRLLPDYLLMLLLGVGLAALAVGMPQMPASRFALAAFAGAITLALLCVAVQTRWTGITGMAAGDLKLIAVLALWFSYKMLPLLLFVACFAGLVYILVIRCVTGVRLRTIAFGPCLALGALVVHVLQRLNPGETG